MLTQRDIETQQTTGLIPPDRLRAAQYALRQLAWEARAASYEAGDERQAAALRGKAGGYRESATMLETLLAGNPIPVPKRVKRKRRLARKTS